MKTALSILCLILASYGFAQERHLVYFDSDLSEPSVEEIARLEEFISRLKKSGIDSISLSGHTDASASTEYNQTLSERRVRTVKTILDKNLEPGTSYRTAALGETQPLTRNNDEEGKKQNRRVEIVVYSSNKVESPAFQPESELWYFDQWGKEVQEFTITPDQATQLQGKEGTVIVIPPDAVCGSASMSSVVIRLEEYYDHPDIILAGLTTTSKDEPIETAGMVNIRAFHQGKEVKLCKNIAVLFPKNADTKGFQGFKGEWNDDHINWDPIGDTLQSFDSRIFNQRFDSEMSRAIWIRCGWGCRKGIFRKGGPLLLNNGRKTIRKDEIRRYLRRRYWFCSRVSMEVYYNAYKRYKGRMKDTLSANAMDYILQNYVPPRDIKEYIDSLSDGGNFEPELMDKATNYIITQTGSFGFINCDRFTRDRRPKRNFRFEIGASAGVVVARLVFHRIKSILTGFKVKESVKFSDIPAGEKVTLIIMKYEDEKIQLASAEFELGQTPKYNFTPISKSEMAGKIAKITASIK